MSIKAIDAVLAAKIEPSTNKFVAVVLANHCNDDGGSLFLSMGKIAEYVGVTRGQARRIVHAFIDQGLLVVLGNASGGDPGITPDYQLRLDRIAALPRCLTPRKSRARMDATGSTGATGGTDARGRLDAHDPLHGCAVPLAPMQATPGTGATLPVIDPSVSVIDPGERASREAPAAPSRTALNGKAVKLKASKRCPPDFVIAAELRAWAQEHVPHVAIEAETEAFMDHEFRTAHHDWPAAWRTWMRNADKFKREREAKGVPPEAAAKPAWYETLNGCRDMGETVGVYYRDGYALLPFPVFRNAVIRAVEAAEAAEAARLAEQDEQAG